MLFPYVSVAVVFSEKSLFGVCTMRERAFVRDAT